MVFGTSGDCAVAGGGCAAIAGGGDGAAIVEGAGSRDSRAAKEGSCW